MCMCVLFYSSFVCISARVNVYFKTTIVKQNINIILIAGVPKSQTLPCFHITAPPSVCVPDVIGALAVWIQTQKGKKKTPDVCSSYMVRIYGCIFCSFHRLNVSAPAYVFKSKVHGGSAVRFGWAPPGFPITAHHVYAFLL